MQCRSASVILMSLSLQWLYPVCAFAEGGMPRDQRTPARSEIKDFDAGLGAAPANTARSAKPLAPQLIMYFEGWDR